MNRQPLFPTRGAPPQIGAKSRKGAAISRRAYGAAQPHRLLSDWAGTSRSANDSTRYQAKPLRHRARELRENSPIIARFASLVRENVIGPDGITLQAIVPSSRGTNTAQSTKIETAWYAWAAHCSPDGRPWVEVCAQLAESWRVEGETMLELIPSPAAPCGLWVRVLDADMLDEQHTVSRTASGGQIIQGVEFDAVGRVVAYHLHRVHPSHGHGHQHRVVPAGRLLYLAHRSRPEQVRGITTLAPVMLLVQHLEKLQEALVVLNRVTASKMGALIPGEFATPLEGADGVPPIIEQTPGEWWTLPHGWDVKMLDPGQPTQEYDAFARHLLREIASGIGVAYSSLTGDLSDVNYSSMRAGLLVERAAWQSQQGAFVDAIVEPVFALWMQTAWYANAIDVAPSQTPAAIAAASQWHPRRWPWVDPLKDAQGIQLLYDMGLTTLTREANKQGLSFTTLVDERKAENAYLDQQGVTLGTLAKATPDEQPIEQPNTQKHNSRPLRAVS